MNDENLVYLVLVLNIKYVGFMILDADSPMTIENLSSKDTMAL